MLINRLAVFAALILALIGLAKALESLEFLDGNLEGVEECRQKNNISPEEYQNFMENLLNETVELKYKCHVKCLMERQLEKWLNYQGKLYLNQTNITNDIEELTKCMEQADEEPCSYAFKLVVCGITIGIQPFDYDSSEEYVDSLEEEELLELTPEAEQ